ncbi:MAG: endonuclease/exonuclease/phosphatase family metal-dependent hydrolase [Saprospiraceae bacterium]|jgi:endonuclease/exonuclease/phosphatase family metal-dependent hydrolase
MRILLQLVFILIHSPCFSESFSNIVTDLDYRNTISKDQNVNVERSPKAQEGSTLRETSLIERDTELKMLSLNVWALPFWHLKSKQKRRYKEIPHALLGSDADIICIQEAFSKKFRKKLLPLMDGEYFTESNYRCNKRLLGPFIKDCHGGLITFSKYPIISEVFYPFPKYAKMSTPERLGEKGFLITHLEAPSGIISVINTHLYSGKGPKAQSFRMKQLSFLNNTVALIPKVFKSPIFLMGDLNFQTPDLLGDHLASIEYNYILDSMNLTDPLKSICEDNFTIHQSNPYHHFDDDAEKLDYCLYNAPANIQIDCTQSSTMFTGSNAISDHYGWFSNFTLSKDPLQLDRIAQYTASVDCIPESIYVDDEMLSNASSIHVFKTRIDIVPAELDNEGLLVFKAGTSIDILPSVADGQ